VNAHQAVLTVKQQLRCLLYLLAALHIYLLAALLAFSELRCFQLAALLNFFGDLSCFYILEKLEKLLAAARSTDASRHAPGLHLVSDAALLALECLLTLKVSKAASNAASRAASK
jgi:hypothetical protein